MARSLPSRASVRTLVVWHGGLRGTARALVPHMSNGFPREILHDDQTWRPTGKTGISLRNGKATAEYESQQVRGARIWADASGKIVTVDA